MTGNQSDLRDTVFRSMIRAAVLEGSFYIASDGSDSIFSIAVWFGPGKALYKRCATSEVASPSFKLLTTIILTKRGTEKTRI